MELVRVRETFCTYLQRLRREVILQKQGIEVLSRHFGSTDRGAWYALEYDLVVDRPTERQVA